MSMISNEDRVEAARFLRSCNCDSESYAKCYEISEALFGKKYAICDFNVPCGKIADLIDRQTCHLVEDEDGRTACSECGCTALYLLDATYCPDCGSIIERRR